MCSRCSARQPASGGPEQAARSTSMGTFNYQKYDPIRAMDRSTRPLATARPGHREETPATPSRPAASLRTARTVPAPPTTPNLRPSGQLSTRRSVCRTTTRTTSTWCRAGALGALVKGTFAIRRQRHIRLFAEDLLRPQRDHAGLFADAVDHHRQAGLPTPGGGKWYPTARGGRGRAPGYRGDLFINWRMVDGGQRRDKVTSQAPAPSSAPRAPCRLRLQGRLRLCRRQGPGMTS